MSVNMVTRVIRAEGSSDLSEDGGDIDVVRAVGVAGVRKRMGSLLPRFLSSGGHECRIGLLDLLTVHVGQQFHALSKLERRAAATGALYLYLVPRCVACSGRGFEVMKDAPMLSDIPCKECRGSGRNELQGAEKVRGPLAWASNEIARAEQQFSGAVGRKLGKD